jgi:glycosyltransferase involved in cell wall biosynthesis
MSRPRHVCVVTETYPPEINGVASTLAQLVAGMRARGHTVSMVRPRRRPADFTDPAADPPTTLVGGMTLPGYRGLRLGFPAGAALRAAWRRNRPDVVYVATEGPLGWSAVRIGARLGIPVYSGFHTNFHSYVQHYRAGWLRRPAAAYLRRFHNATAGTLVATQRLRDELARAGYANLSVLGRGVDSRRFHPSRRSPALREAWGASANDLVVLYGGRIAPEKNVGLAVTAYRAMQAAHRALRFVIVGDGPLRAALQRAHPDLVFCGFRRGDDLAAHYASADMFVVPSETETFGNVTLEAMASGLAVLAYDYAAAHVHIEDGVTGVLARPGDAAGFVDAAVKLVHAPGRLPEMRRRARAAMEAVDWTRVVERFEHVLIGAHREENDRAEQLAVARPGTLRHGGSGLRGGEAGEADCHPARAGADAAAAATAVRLGPGAALHRC